MKQYDVAIVGGGPAGSLTAALLARRGYGVVVFDKARFPRDKACAEYCSPGVEAVLRRVGVWPQLATQVQRIPGMRICIDNQPVLPIVYGDSGNPRTAFSLARRALDMTLLEFAARSGARVEEDVRVRRVIPDPLSMTLRTTGRGTREEATWNARIVVAADGLLSAVTRSLQVRSWSHRPRRLGLVRHYAEIPGTLGWGEMHVTDGVYCGLAPMANGIINVGVVSGLNPRTPVKRVAASPPASDLVERRLTKLPWLLERLRDGRPLDSTRGIGPMTRCVASTSGRGYLLVGDSAGFLDPFTGEGLFRAMRGAELAAVTIDSALQKPTAEVPDLSEYSRMRKYEFRRKERLTWVVQLALQHPASMSRICRNLASHEQWSRVAGETLGDIRDAGDVVRPSFLAALLRPRAVELQNSGP